jgi:hypothetical protein
MDKYQRREYRTNWPDGVYEVVHITLLESPKELQHRYSRLIEIKGGSVVCPPIKFPGHTKTEDTIFSQHSFFEVNEVIESIPFE